jgi:hypothetical protein
MFFEFEQGWRAIVFLRSVLLRRKISTVASCLGLSRTAQAGRHSQVLLSLSQLLVLPLRLMQHRYPSIRILP